MSDDDQFPHAPDFIKRVPGGDSLHRSVCVRCGFIDYQNPKVVVGSAVRHGDKVLMCRRAIEPRKNFWTLPAGFMETGETLEQGASREAWEEARIKIEFDGVLGVFSVPHISQVQVMYRARLIGETFEPGPESLEVKLFAWDDIPWTELAFPSVLWTLDALRANWNADCFVPATNPTAGQFSFPPSGPPRP